MAVQHRAPSHGRCSRGRESCDDDERMGWDWQSEALSVYRQNGYAKEESLPAELLYYGNSVFNSIPNIYYPHYFIYKVVADTDQRKVLSKSDSLIYLLDRR